MQLLIHASPFLDKLKHWRQALSFNEVQLTTSQKVVLWSIGVVGTSAMVVGVLSRYLARRRAKPILNPRIQRAINKRISRMRSPNGGMGSVASSGGRSSPLGFSERLSLASGSIGSGGGDAAPLSPQQLGVMVLGKKLNASAKSNKNKHFEHRRHLLLSSESSKTFGGLIFALIYTVFHRWRYNENLCRVLYVFIIISIFLWNRNIPYVS